MTLNRLWLIPILALTLCGFACPTGTKKLATASDAIAHSLANADAAALQAVSTGVITSPDQQAFHALLQRVASAGLILDQGIRANESATTLSAKVNSFMDAFNALNTSGVAGIKDKNLQLTLSTIITTAEASVAIIAATTGGK